MSDHERVCMTEGVDIDLKGSTAYLRGGEFYLLEPEQAERLVDLRKAYYEGDPPTCDACGAWFEGVGAWTTLDRHRGTDHEGNIFNWDPEDGDPPPLDDGHPDVESLREHTVEQIREECHRIGVATADVVPTGASGRVKDDWIRHLLRARGRRGFYARQEEE